MLFPSAVKHHVTFIIIINICLLRVVDMRSRGRGIIRFCHAGNALMCLTVMSCFCISAYPPHLSASRTRSFIIPPAPAAAAAAIFTSHAVG